MRRQPAGLVPDRLVLGVEFVPDDTDRNGYYDTFRVVVSLYDSRYAPSIFAPGAFTFLLRTSDNKEIARWQMDAVQSEKAWGMSGALPAYVFRLSLRDVGTDKVQVGEALIGCTFTPTGGKPVESGSWLTVLVGRTR